MTYLVSVVREIFGAPPVGKEHYEYIVAAALLFSVIWAIGYIIRRFFR